MMRSLQAGFTLVEIAFVLVIVTILLGYTVAMFPLQQELKQYRHAKAEMDSVIEHLIAFAQVNGRLPCPDTSAGGGTIDGEEDRLGTNACEAYFGFLPAKTLGMNGKYNAAGVLVDPWDSGYGYAISNINAGADANIDLVTPNGIRDEGIANVMPDLLICDDSDTLGMDLDCDDAGSNVVGGSNGEVAAVIISLGKDSAIPATSNIQAENLDNFNDGSLDKVYIFSPRRDDYDDLVRWISTNFLFSKMIEADQLP
jgi:prepilin-type N-terminal cleavage/methylation domain-containing protein